jgi:hypothetical protein
MMKSTLTLLAASLSLSSAALAGDCREFNLSGLYSCRMQGETVRLEISQSGDSFTLGVTLPGGIEQRDALVADGSRRRWREDNRVNEYIGRCERNTLLVDQFLEGNSQPRSYFLLRQGASTLGFEKGIYSAGRRDRTLGMTCRQSE